MTTYRMDQAQLSILLADRQETPTFAASPTRRASWMDAAHGESSVTALREPRCAQSPKGVFFPAAESMGQYGARAETAVQTEQQAAVLVGVRACELRALNYLDQVLLGGDFKDAAYRRRREGAIIVSCDCVDCTESCFCTLVGGRPYPTEGYDVNLTPVDDGYLAEAATPRGEQWLKGAGTSELPAATPDQLARRDALRQDMVERLKAQNAAFKFTASDETQLPLPNDADEAWQKFSADCVECGACTHICPTCHCFYLYDQTLGPEEFERLRTWDSCLLSTYHRMAGGTGIKLTPRPHLFSRLANRVLHKFTYSPQQYGLLGCVGCGRCVDACPGAIDIREVVKELGE